MGKRVLAGIMAFVLFWLWAWTQISHMPAKAGSLQWTAPVNLSHSAALSLEPEIAVDTAGNPLVAWEEAGGGGRIDWTVRSLAGAWSAPADLSRKPESTAIVDNVVLAAGATGDVHAVWYEESSRTTGDADIMYSWRPAGGTWAVPVLATNDFGASLRPDLAVSAGGTAHLVWENFFTIYYAEGSGGSPWGAREKVAGGTNFCHAPSVAVDSAGNVHVVWQWDREQFNHPNIYYSMRSNAGKWSEPLKISGSLGGLAPKLAVGSDGGLHAVWQSGGLMYADKPPGGAWSAPTLVLAGDIGDYDLAVGPAGAVHVVWKVHHIGTSYARRSPDGVWSEGQALLLVGTEGEGAAIAVSAQDVPHIVWQTAGTAPEIYYASANPGAITPTATKTSGPSPTPTTTRTPTPTASPSRTPTVTPTAHSHPITVNTLADVADGSCTDGDCSLRDAIAVASPGYTIDFSVTGTLVLSRWLEVDKDLSILGPGADRLTISGNDATYFFWFQCCATSSVKGLTFAHGLAVIGGGIDVSGATLAIADSVFTASHANFNGAAIRTNYGSQVTLTRCTFADNDGLQGGAIYNGGDSTLIVERSSFSGNNADTGGAIYNTGDSHLTVSRSRFSGNGANEWGGAIENTFGAQMSIDGSAFTGNHAVSLGGAIDNWAGPVSIAGSSFSDNQAGRGGAIANNLKGTLAVVNATFSGNTATTVGGGIDNEQELAVTNATFWGNSAGNWGGGLHDTGTATLKNTIVGNSSSGGECWLTSSLDAASSHNLATDGTCLPGFTQVTPDQLALGKLSGWPSYFPLGPGSVAIDGGTNDGCPSTDQRGWPRPVDGDDDGSAVCDVGAHELTPGEGLLFMPVYLCQTS